MARTARIANTNHRTFVTSQAQETDQQEIARLAYQLYEEHGRTDGHDVEDWLKAEALMRHGKENDADAPPWDDE